MLLSLIHIYHSTNHRVAAEFLVQIGDKVVVELRADEDVVGHIDLQAHARVNIEMVAAGERLGLRSADRGRDAARNFLGNAELGVSDTRNNLQLEFLVIDRRPNTIDIDEMLAVLEGIGASAFGYRDRDLRLIIAPGGHQIPRESRPEPLLKHQVHTKADKNATQPISRRDDTVRVGCDRCTDAARDAVGAGRRRGLIVERSDTDVYKRQGW